MSYQKIKVLSDILEAKDTLVPGYGKEINYPSGYLARDQNLIRSNFFSEQK